MLVVDDEEDIRVLFELYLRGRGRSATIVSSAQAARDACAAATFDVLLLDVSLPLEDGPTLLRSLRAAGVAPVAVWLLSALPEHQLEELGRELEAGIITKPFTLADLDGILGAALDDA